MHILDGSDAAFEWDEAKARTNLRKHGVDFADVTPVFREGAMTELRDKYDFSKGKRGPVLPISPGKTRITIRVDNAVLDWFRAKVHRARGGSYQTLMNGALHEHIDRQSLEQTLRRVLKDELRRLKEK